MNEERITSITMPKWGMSMDEGIVTSWHIDEGAEVTQGQEVVDVESTKIANAIESKKSGLLRRRVAQVGQTFPVGALLGVIADRDVEETEIDSFIAKFTIVALDDDVGPSGPLPETIQVGSNTIRYIKHGEGGTPVIMVHGFGGDLNAWMFNQHALAVDRAVYALDLPGHGGSGKLVGSGELNVLADSVSAIIVESGADYVHLVGHSLGGAVALLTALNNPGNIKSLTLISSAGIGQEINGNYISGFIAAQKRKEMTPVASLLFSDSRLLSRQMVEDLLRMKRISGVESALKAIAKANFEGDHQKIDLLKRQDELNFPVQILWGEDDAVIPMSHAHNIKAARTTVISGAGHMLMMEKASEVNSLLSEFIR